jgi:hypothetical protein
MQALNENTTATAGTVHPRWKNFLDVLRDDEPWLADLGKEHRTAAASLKGSGKVQFEPSPRRPARASLPGRPYRVPSRRKIFLRRDEPFAG